MAAADAEAGRLAPIRRRVALAKTGLAVVGAVVFGAALAFSRAHNAGHPKLKPLASSPRYVAAVRKNVGDTGVIDPPVSSPSAVTSQS